MSRSPITDGIDDNGGGTNHEPSSDIRRLQLVRTDQASPLNVCPVVCGEANVVTCQSILCALRWPNTRTSETNDVQSMTLIAPLPPILVRQEMVRVLVGKAIANVLMQSGAGACDERMNDKAITLPYVSVDDSHANVSPTPWSDIIQESILRDVERWADHNDKEWICVHAENVENDPREFGAPKASESPAWTVVQRKRTTSSARVSAEAGSHLQSVCISRPHAGTDVMQPPSHHLCSQYSDANPPPGPSKACKHGKNCNWRATCSFYHGEAASLATDFCYAARGCECPRPHPNYQKNRRRMY